MQEVNILSSPEFENNEDNSFFYVVEVGDNEDSSWMDFVQYLSL